MVPGGCLCLDVHLACHEAPLDRDHDLSFEHVSARVPGAETGPVSGGDRQEVVDGRRAHDGVTAWHLWPRGGALSWAQLRPTTGASQDGRVPRRARPGMPVKVGAARAMTRLRTRGGQPVSLLFNRQAVVAGGVVTAVA